MPLHSMCSVGGEAAVSLENLAGLLKKTKFCGVFLCCLSIYKCGS